MLVECEHCKIEFNKKPAEVARTRHNFCSKTCSGNYRVAANNSSFHSKYERLDYKLCWPWKGSKNRHGYGVVRYGGAIKLAHRVAYFLENGIWPMKLILHSCDNPECVNPSHLREGTHLDNCNDMWSRNRANTKLTESNVIEIRQSNLSNKELAIKFNVSERNVRAVKAMETWSHVPEPPKESNDD